MSNPILIVLVVIFLGQGQNLFAADLNWLKWRQTEEISFGGFIPDMNAIKIIDAQNGKERRIVYGDRLGLVHVLEWRNDRFQEVWSSSPLRSAVSEIFVDDINVDDELEIVAYTEVGDIIFFRTSDYKQIWRSTLDQFATISGMTISNVDEDPQLELIISGEHITDLSGYRASGSKENVEEERAWQIARVFVFDCKNLFVEWRTEPGVWGRSIVVGDMDDDGNLEIALNTGFVIDANFQRIDWQYRDGFGDLIGYADVDGDGIPELIGEVINTTRPRRFLRIFDVDLQSESFLSTGR